MKILRARLYELERSRIDQRDLDRKIGTGDRLKELGLIIFLKVELQIIE